MNAFASRRRAIVLACLFAGPWLLASAARAAVFTVTSNADSGAGTLRQAILDANATPDADQVHFNLSAGQRVIVPQTPLPALAAPVDVDATSQPGWAGVPLVSLDGSAAGGTGLRATAGSCTVRGLAVYGFATGLSMEGDAFVVKGNWIGLTAAGAGGSGNTGTGLSVGGDNGTVGGASSADRNVISSNLYGLDLVGGGNTVQGNRIGTNVAGTAAIGNAQTGIRLYGDGNTIGGTGAGAGNLVSGNGTGLQVISGSNNVLQGNRIGTDASGAAALGNKSYAIRVIGASGNTIGGTAAGAGNLLSGNGRGVALDADAPGNTLQGNVIGLAADGLAALGNQGNGLEVNSSGNVIGGAAAGAGNVIAANSFYGIFFSGGAASGNIVRGNRLGVAADGTTLRGNFYDLVFYGASGNTIGGGAAGEGNTVAGSANQGAWIWFGTHNRFSGNSFLSNAGAGIELDPQGFVPNDALDADSGPNEQQNLPVLSTATVASGQVTLAGSLRSAASKSYRVEFFSSASCDASGFGEGAHYLGAADVATNASGVATISAKLAWSGADTVVTATATSPDGDTSEFSPCVTVGAAASAGALQFALAQFAGREEAGSVTVTVTRTGGSAGSVSVQYATSNGSATAPGDYAATSGTLSFADGEVVKAFNVSLVSDGATESTEQVNLTLSSPGGGAVLGARSTAHVQLYDYDPDLPGVYLSDVTVVEGDSGTKNADFTVTVTPTDHAVSFRLKTVGGTAKDGEDYDDGVFDLSFAAGEAPKKVSVAVRGDAVAEPQEAFFLQVSGAITPGGYAAGVAQATIVDNDGAGACGNGTLDSGETCDDGDVAYTLGDYCSAACVRFPCGVPTKVDGTKPKSSDALFVLKAAVSASNCSKKVCDVNNSNSVTASDALAILKKAVGQAVVLNCPA